MEIQPEVKEYIQRRNGLWNMKNFLREKEDDYVEELNKIKEEIVKLDKLPSQRKQVIALLNAYKNLLKVKNEFLWDLEGYLKEQEASMEELIYIKNYLTKEIVSAHPEGGKLERIMENTESYVRNEFSNNLTSWRNALLSLVNSEIEFIHSIAETKSIGELVEEATKEYLE